MIHDVDREALIDGVYRNTSLSLTSGPVRVSEDPKDGDDLPPTRPAGFVRPDDQMGPAR